MQFEIISNYACTLLLIKSHNLSAVQSSM